MSLRLPIHALAPVIALVLLAGSALLEGSVVTGQMVTTGGEPSLHHLSYRDVTLKQYAAPVGVSWRWHRVRIDANTALARATLHVNDQDQALTGLTDITVRTTVPVLSDRARIVFAANLPSGRETVDTLQMHLAAALATDIFTLPIASFGSGFGVTGGLAFAQPVGTWVLGLAASYRMGAAYQPISETRPGQPTEFRPGGERRFRLALENPQRTGRAARFALSWSQYAPDEIDQRESFLHPGDRLLAEAMMERPLGTGSSVTYGWAMFRARGQVTNPAYAATGAAARRLSLGGGTKLFLPLGPAYSLRPTAELLAQWTDSSTLTSPSDGVLLRLGSGIAIRTRQLVLEPAALLQMGVFRQDTAMITGLIIRGGVAWAPPRGN